MILTRDNILRFIKEKKAVTPTMIAETFETTTMIASAALSELAKDKLIGITKLKLASSPYYYDLKQREHLMVLGEKHLSKGEKEIFLKLKSKEILSDNSLNIQEKLAIENIKDFAIPLILTHDEKDMTFWVWYLRNLDETRKQINDALTPQIKPEPKEVKKPIKTKKTITTQPKPSKISQTIKKQVQSSNKPKQRTIPTYNNQPQHTQQHYNRQEYQEPQYEQSFNQGFEQQQQNQRAIPQEQAKPAKRFKPTIASEENQIEDFIENFFVENYLKIENKNKEEKGILYSTSMQLSKISVQIDCFYFYKKTNEAELIKFYTSSLKPKIVFILNCPKKLLKLSENIENLTIINI